MTWFLTITLAFALSGMLVYLYFLRQGQFDDLEDVKYQLFREEDDNA
ncbi:MAG: cbb3-type cytochrome oxidase assembly protein CcoS [Waddliaceae bacterium]